VSEDDPDGLLPDWKEIKIKERFLIREKVFVGIGNTRIIRIKWGKTD
jgi:hypothetical protein